MREAYIVRQCRQVLYHGSWNSDDCVWDWENLDTEFSDESTARKFLKKFSPSNDVPIIRLYRAIYDRYGCVDEELLDELS